MTLPSIIQASLTPLGLPDPEAGLFGFLKRLKETILWTPPPGYHVLEGFLDGAREQEQTKWCWAAVAVAVNEYWLRSRPHHPSRQRWTQCEVACGQHPDGDCCGAGASRDSRCNKWGYLSAALETVRLPYRHVPTKQPVWEECTREIDHRRPLPVRVELGKLRHFVVVFGYGSLNRIAVWDPARGVGAKELHINDWRKKVGKGLDRYFLAEQANGE
ncbi:papain-like cysteine protease family protein [Thalassobaculum sp. OXR-137]|uniref:papain-like cysteine protease family protein n=1 Tax=Thalassobaculum sp. OXR-137 TaxID=3100173 RepID=UPI002AC9040C|nr:papain-like cysteine protease family protein [Thalassobaculum sp. OXR-137]WPZ32726.1 papain-like cysteine protease family protein [Thalassobaculum sp. OXR-137]